MVVTVCAGTEISLLTSLLRAEEVTL